MLIQWWHARLLNWQQWQSTNTSWRATLFLWVNITSPCSPRFCTIIAYTQTLNTMSLWLCMSEWQGSLDGNWGPLTGRRRFHWRSGPRLHPPRIPRYRAKGIKIATHYVILVWCIGVLCALYIARRERRGCQYPQSRRVSQGNNGEVTRLYLMLTIVCEF